MANDRDDASAWNPRGLDEALRDAFEPDRPTPLSVLAGLGPEARARPGVLLAEDETPGPVLAPRGGAEGRYRILGEIARGGVGVVLKGHDVDLGRDVALKMLREEHGDSPEVLQRFVEEAQIGGQLQHPGIVPVYEMGLGRERRPYFTMKLVKGRTLASILAERTDPSVDLQRLLRVFEAACQTIAYAHARGVIHRDLKPANVMVGAFGEVLVVDWGMGKVLSRGGVADERRSLVPAEPERSVIETIRSDGSGSASVVGSVLGTPRYMPPEQARGEVDRVDERADVFALGAVLCEILTGRPPYAGTDQEVFAQAARGDVADACDRLDACGADGDLVALAKACLAPAPAARPRDAGAVAKAVGDHLASLDAKARAAQVEAAAARVRAEEEHRRRRLGWALAAAVAGLVVLGAGGWAWRESDRRRQADALAAQIEAAVTAASELRAQVVAAGPDEALALLREASAHAARARDLAAGAGATARSRERVDGLVAGLASDATRARARLERRQREAETQRRLEEIRVARADSWDADATATAYAQALTGFLGLDPEAEPEAAAAAIASSPLRGDLVLALEDGLEMRRREGRAPGGLAQVLDRADPSPWRARLRAAAGDRDALRRLADDGEADTMPVATRVILARLLGEAGDDRTARDVAAAAARSAPDDFWAAFECGRWHERGVPPLPDGAVRWYSAALALRPRSPAAWNNLGAALLRTRSLAEGEQALRRALELQPDYALALSNLGSVLNLLGRLPEAEAACREAIRLDPQLAWAHNNLGIALADQGRLEEALEAYEAALRVDPNCASACYNRGSTLYEAGRLEEAIPRLEEAVRMRGDQGYAWAWTTLGLTYQKQGRYLDAIEAFENAVEDEPGDAKGETNLGCAFRLAGRLNDALDAVHRAIHLDPTLSAAWLQLGNVLGARGASKEEVLAAFDEAIRLEPDNATAHMNRGNVFARDGDHEEAMRCYERARDLAPDMALVYVNLGNAQRHLGRPAEAIASLRRALELGADVACAHHALGDLHYQRGEWREAVRAYRDAVRVDPSLVNAHNGLGLALRYVGDHDASIEALREAIRRQPGYVPAWLNLVQSLDAAGRLAEAVEAAQKALDAIAERPELEPAARDALAWAERRLTLSERLPAIASGEDEAANPEEALELADVARVLRRHAACVRLTRDALAAKPALAAAAEAPRYNAACAAALAGTGHGADVASLDDAARAGLREQALAWLREEIAADRERARDDPSGHAGLLEHVLRDPDLVQVRDPDALASLPETERDAWSAFWNELRDDLRERSTAEPHR